MKTKTIELYEYSELEEKAKEKALRDHNNSYFGYEIQVDLDNLLEELMKDHKITMIDYREHPVIFYDFGYSQGSGVMFEGQFYWDDYIVKVKHEGRYCHSHAKNIEILYRYGDREGYWIEESEPEERFEKIYQEICKKLEKAGYEELEYLTSEEYFSNHCEENDFHFTKDGTIEQK